MMRGHCVRCLAPVIHAVTRTGNPIALDAAPHGDGALVVDIRPGSSPLVRNAEPLLDRSRARYRPHFCEDRKAAAP